MEGRCVAATTASLSFFPTAVLNSAQNVANDSARAGRSSACRVPSESRRETVTSKVLSASLNESRGITISRRTGAGCQKALPPGNLKGRRTSVVTRSRSSIAWWRWRHIAVVVRAVLADAARVEAAVDERLSSPSAGAGLSHAVRALAPPCPMEGSAERRLLPTWRRFCSDGRNGP